ncbi:LPS O-antigen chain length determinant protein, WzzB/FepE family [Vibrio xiamenensis]|uniref:LPS O-antigen chain length determinant protein, WzzB/FepE family n=1 Tax=Vibrio xiamenensis TaxID=861298 RepID=A0A1G8BL93_9VIBR|nr:Wzz/FepE/Etk N-terminal domain-containing protein [Vibrio xiamenensis]SDH33977.1 LPS O-antigen chain length determinant protein, WzzB/FepE family [Vibrio xiamenensis]
MSSLLNEQSLSQVQSIPLYKNDDEIDLKELFYALWTGKLTIIVCTLIATCLGVAIALSKPNTYQATATLVAAQGEQAGGLAAMASQFGGLASLAGVSLSNGSTDTKTLDLAVLKSRKFINAFIEKHDLLVSLVATKKWDKESNQLIYNDDLYDKQTNRWLNDKDGKSLKPTEWEAYKAFSKILSVSEAKDTGLVTVSVTHFSPYIAQQWVEWLVKDLNEKVKADALDESRTNISYLNKQLEKTNIVDMQSVFYQLIEDQTKSLMLAEVREEYAFKTVDPAVVPEEKAGPKRALICVLSLLLGGMLGVAIVLIRFAFRK